MDLSIQEWKSFKCNLKAQLNQHTDSLKKQFLSKIKLF